MQGKCNVVTQARKAKMHQSADAAALSSLATRGFK